MKQKQPLISLCMIVGNVEEYIERCLTSFAPISDEIIIVRAIGSQSPDRTLQIAKQQFGALTSEYRNDQMSFDLATGKYCFWCDSDDVIEPGSAELIRWHAEQGESELFIFPYNIYGRGVVVPRERMMRRGSGRWKYPVHECFTFSKPVDGIQDDRAVITHLPHNSKTGSNQRNLTILQSMDRATMPAGLLYHLAGELIGAGESEAAKAACRDALASPDLGTAERYEIYTNLARMSEHPAHQSGYLNLAYQADPCRREALGMLACVAMDYDRPEKALAYARQMMATEPPKTESWNDRRDAYGWLGADIMQQALRVNGRHEEAETLRQRVLSGCDGPTIALCHATRGRRQKAAACRKLWLDMADRPEAIEHIFIIDENDEESLGLRRMHHIAMPDDGRGPVAAWNLGALATAAPIIVQLSDDWIPQAKWDTAILAAIGDTTRPTVLAVSDGHRTDDLLCMAILTRARYEAQGYLFHPEFFSMYSDNWFSHCAFRDGVVIDARDRITFEHRHPVFTGAEIDETYARSNAQINYVTGKSIFEKLQSEQP
jgi:tetratricopeptide (TPR) repeat protein